ncbi:MAG: hypothetical protein US50_C0002G0022 [Candidatus Nomurabacteria bacterium GW2011_GWB1_37_5]|uniref:Protein kinase domain-containing protein n=1 Tax=Candidatus Nomurabacteria bacterium GW2011_GWB1_37_5 TaxID=1618742 RepID=A0A0G0H188_9BACT|nr:MAG: hypothetical protein US50_C0002G0022 [Candidatus Nomurabacteria bacterium GW2011_GWB1_37_5]
MKKIGEGWQYSVYDLGNGRVLKKFHSWPKAFWVILKKTKLSKKYPFWSIPKYINSMKMRASRSFQILKSCNIPQSWIGNPLLINGLDYEQDKVRSLYEILEKVNTEEGKKIVDKFIEFNIKLLNLGIIDKSFNITKNYGLNHEGDVVLIDIGEIFDDPRDIARQRQEKIWLRHYVVDCIQDKEVCDHFICQMNDSFGLLEDKKN